jgi:hypothetical protein
MSPLPTRALTLGSLRSTCAEVLEAGKEQEQLIEALLTLARSERGLDHRGTLDLAVIASDVVESRQLDATTRGLSVDTVLKVAPISGDALSSSGWCRYLVDNALRHTIFQNGDVKVSVGTSLGRGTLSVSNTGPRIAAYRIDRLLQPFQRLDEERGGTTTGRGWACRSSPRSSARTARPPRASSVGGRTRYRPEFPLHALVFHLPHRIYKSQTSTRRPSVEVARVRVRRSSPETLGREDPNLNQS